MHVFVRIYFSVYFFSRHATLLSPEIEGNGIFLREPSFEPSFDLRCPSQSLNGDMLCAKVSK